LFRRTEEIKRRMTLDYYCRT